MIKLNINYPKNRYNGKSPWLDKEWLYNQYVKCDKSSREIANEYGCKPSTITTYVSRYGLKKIPKPKPNYNDKDLLYKKYVTEKKPPSIIAMEMKCRTTDIKKALRENGIKLRKQIRKRDVDKLDLHELYVRKQMSINQISQLTKSSRQTIKRKLIELNISIRGVSEAQLALQNSLEISKKLKDKDWLEEEYTKKRRSSVDIASELDCCYSTVVRWLQKHGIKIKDDSESKIGVMTGAKHPNWKGGITDLNALCREYFTTNIKDKIAERDGYTCQLCGKKHCILHVHHIYPFSRILNDIYQRHPKLDPIGNKSELYKIITQDEVFNDYSNLITLCKECHWYKVHGYTKKN